ncbi:hypothetical protein [Streptomyces pseudovenezuelae]|uniref:hypothetical protein n=1 Tax=Streptomyces pseudovenezuelae TaxID=67350 RepID=UPI002E37982B|nr:hypothetical protein [Streptomyces pseudovenezuelae]
MTRWSSFGRRRGDRPAATGGARPSGSPPHHDTADAADQVLVEDYDGLLLLRSPSDDSLSPADIGDLARGQRSDEATVTLVAGTASVAADSFWPRLSQLLDTLGDSGTDTVRLAMAGAGRDSADRPATARRIADAWGLTVEAPDGPPLLVPGGTLFVPGLPLGSATDGGWWRFAPQTHPKPLGPRSPAPSWQSALRTLPASTDAGCVVEQIPAGVLIRPAGAAPTKPGDLYHSVPVSPGRLAVVVGVPYGEDVLADDVADVLAALPAEVRTLVRLAPGGRRDLLPLAQAVADRLDAEVEVMTGLPLIAAGRPLGTYSVQSVLVGADQTPRWLPFVDAVVCRPARGAAQAPAPRLLRWTTPVPRAAQPTDGVVALSEQWQVTVTRAGLWVGPVDGPRLSHTARQVSPSGPLIEVGLPGERLDSSLWPALSGLLAGLPPALRASVTLHVHGIPHDGGRELRSLAARHGLRTIRFASFSAPAPTPRETTQPPLASGRLRTSSDPGHTEQSAPAPAPVPASLPPEASRSAAAPVTAGATPTHSPRKITATQETERSRRVGTPGEGTVPEGTAVAEAAGGASVGTGSPQASVPRRDLPTTRAPKPLEPDAAQAAERTLPKRESIIETVRRAEAEAEAEPDGVPEQPKTPRPQQRGGAPDGPVTEQTAPAPADTSDLDATDPGAVPAAPPGVVTTSSVPAPAPSELPDAPLPPAPAEAASEASAEPPETGEATQPQSTPLPPVPFSPGHRSTEDDRTAFRALADAEWDRHGTAVARALARMPALRGKEQEAARADLIALRLYLHAAQGPLSHQTLTRALHAHETDLLPYLACLASALNRLPSYRGVVLRSTGAAPDSSVPRPGTLLRDAAPVSATPLDPVRPSMTTGASYVIWSVGARRVRQLSDPGDGPEEVVFTPGAVFRVLDVRRAGQATARQIFLRELPAHGPVRPDPEADSAALARLDEAVRGRSAPASADQWPERCSGPFGAAEAHTTANH